MLKLSAHEGLRVREQQLLTVFILTRISFWTTTFIVQKMFYMIVIVVTFSLSNPMKDFKNFVHTVAQPQTSWICKRLLVAIGTVGRMCGSKIIFKKDYWSVISSK